MAYNISAILQAVLNITESPDTVAAPARASAGGQIVYSGYSKELRTSSISGKAVDFSTTLVAADKDNDFSAAPWAGNLSIPYDATGLKLFAMILHAPKENLAGVTVKPQGANGYPLFGGASDQLTLLPGARHVMFFDADEDSEYIVPNPAVAAGAKDFRYSGTIGDKLNCLAVFVE